VNVVVPAHYHGSIVGVTLAFMGLAYTLLPVLGFPPVTARFARWQPLVYGGGQLMHVLGLAWSGGYGVQRKVAGAEQVLHTLGERIGMGMMGLGGLIAVVGGVMFVVACLQSMWPARRLKR
jgi:heme/copper-type cytochrome/quinol oxidase subunit 1